MAGAGAVGADVAIRVDPPSSEGAVGFAFATTTETI